MGPPHGRERLSDGELQHMGDDHMQRLIDLLLQARRVVILTGAGISTESGIPDFRGPNGVWTRDPGAARLSSLQAYVQDPELRRRAWRLRMQHPAWTAEPNQGHRAIARLQQAGVVSLLITQNIDGLHLAAGSPPSSTIEIHGTIREVVCLDCRRRQPMQDALARVEAGEEDPPCRRCGGILKSATVSFGQNLDPAQLRAGLDAARSCDLFMAVGTSLTVYPVADLPAVARASGAGLIIVNAQPTPLDEIADIVTRGPAGETLTAVAASAETARHP